jgi:hypothetical protein
LATELIKGTKYEDNLKKFKDRRNIQEPCERSRLSNGWYRGFMSRNSETLKRRKCKVKDSNCHTWCTYKNFSNMYTGVYEAMVEAGVAEKLETEIMFDKNGEETQDKKHMVGRPTKFRLLHPESVLFVDETGCNTNMKGDGHVGGELFMLPVEAVDCGVDGIVTDIHFSVLCFTSGIGNPVMCAVILKSQKDIKHIPYSWKLGIDITKNLEQTNKNNIEFFEKHYNDNSMMPGGPTCTYLGKEVPCFVGASPNASITSEMLTRMLELMDELQVFDRSNGIHLFLLLDGHHSRTCLPFLKYINDDNHPWMVCIGVPYGTHLW